MESAKFGMISLFSERQPKEFYGFQASLARI